MVYVTGNWKVAIAGLVASLVIFGVVFFAVIMPSENTANQAVKTGLQQTQQALNQAQKQTNAAESSVQQQVSSATGQAQTTLNKAAGQAQTTLSKAAKLTTCLSQAGTDVTKISSCQANFGH
jgi:predicted PurR-regulated permease PerM